MYVSLWLKHLDYRVLIRNFSPLCSFIDPKITEREKEKYIYRNKTGETHNEHYKDIRISKNGVVYARVHFNSTIFREANFTRFSMCMVLLVVPSLFALWLSSVFQRAYFLFFVSFGHLFMGTLIKPYKSQFHACCRTHMNETEYIWKKVASDSKTDTFRKWTEQKTKKRNWNAYVYIFSINACCRFEN